MRKLTEESVMKYFGKNKHIFMLIDNKFLFISSKLVEKESIIRRLTYLVNECGWKFAWF